MQQLAGEAQLAIAVFAYEYRPYAETVHRRQADLCFSRTGVARVGTADALYNPQQRGFLPFVEGQPNQMRVIPARYGAFIAARHTGQPARFGPMDAQPIDEDLEFWVPLHKVFDGNECLAGMDLTVQLENHQINEKSDRSIGDFAIPAGKSLTFSTRLSSLPRACAIGRIPMSSRRGC